VKRLAQAADKAGMDGFIPLGRWKANSRTQRPEDDRWMEVITMAAAVAAVTERIAVFSTVHMPIIHPVIMAAQVATIDHVAGGRFALNVTAGFNQAEMDMFGLKLLPHDERYAYAAEWMELVKKIWTSEDIFDWEGKYFHGKTIINKPLPLQRPYPVIMSAGSSGAGRDFAAQHADLNFVHLPSWEGMAEAVSSAKDDAVRKFGKHPGILAGGYIVCADTEKEALRRYRYVTREKMDVETAKIFTKDFNSESQSALVWRRMNAPIAWRPASTPCPSWALPSRSWSAWWRCRRPGSRASRCRSTITTRESRPTTRRSARCSSRRGSGAIERNPTMRAIAP